MSENIRIVITPGYDPDEFIKLMMRTDNCNRFVMFDVEDWDQQRSFNAFMSKLTDAGILVTDRFVQNGKIRIVSDDDIFISKNIPIDVLAFLPSVGLFIRGEPSILRRYRVINEDGVVGLVKWYSTERPKRYCMNDLELGCSCCLEYADEYQCFRHTVPKMHVVAAWPKLGKSYLAQNQWLLNYDEPLVEKFNSCSLIIRDYDINYFMLYKTYDNNEFIKAYCNHLMVDIGRIATSHNYTDIVALVSGELNVISALVKLYGVPVHVFRPVWQSRGVYVEQRLGKEDLSIWGKYFDSQYRQLTALERKLKKPGTTKINPLTITNLNVAAGETLFNTFRKHILPLKP